MRVLILTLSMTVIALQAAQARSTTEWRGPGWYIVNATTRNGASIEDGRFPDGSSCAEALAHRIAFAKHPKIYAADSCVQLAQDLDRAVDADEPTGALPAVGASYSRPQTMAAAPVTQFPRFASLKIEGVNVHRGPAESEPVRWVYLRKGWPVEIVAEAGPWRQIRDRNGDMGWVEATALDASRTGILVGDRMQAIRSSPDRSSMLIAWAEPDVLFRLRRCDGRWCEVEALNVDGFVERSSLWGLRPSEILN
jgi:SH3-like domain-containing protein